MKLPVLTLLGLASGGAPLPAQQPALDTLPAAVVQRFVDAANAGNVGAMMTTVAPEAAFTSLPSGQPLATGRDSVRAMYQRMFTRQPAGFRVTVESRMTDGPFIVDHEHFQNAGGVSQGHATWIYHVAGGLIRRAWVLRRPTPEVPGGQ
jgi:hypothetical protein